MPLTISIRCAIFSLKPAGGMDTGADISCVEVSCTPYDAGFTEGSEPCASNTGKIGAFLFYKSANDHRSKISLNKNIFAFSHIPETFDSLGPAMFNV